MYASVFSLLFISRIYTPRYIHYIRLLNINSIISQNVHNVYTSQNRPRPPDHLTSFTVSELQKVVLRRFDRKYLGDKIYPFFWLCNFFLHIFPGTLTTYSIQKCTLFEKSENRSTLSLMRTNVLTLIVENNYYGLICETGDGPALWRLTANMRLRLYGRVRSMAYDTNIQSKPTLLSTLVATRYKVLHNSNAVNVTLFKIHTKSTRQLVLQRRRTLQSTYTVNAATSPSAATVFVLTRISAYFRGRDILPSPGGNRSGGGGDALGSRRA